MSSLFDNPEMALGYARARPAVHPLVVDMLRTRLQLTEPVDTALDLGCGAGLSTRPLLPLTRCCVGVDPAEAMVRAATTTAPGASFATAAAEALPFPTDTFDVIAAAGSLDFVDLERSLPEARRVLRPDGTLVVYDFAAGRTFRDADGDALATWFTMLRDRYPAVPRDPLDLDEPTGFRLRLRHEFAVELTMTRDAYVAYVMTETNVAAAIGRGTPEPEIERWCTDTLTPVFAGNPSAIVFTGYVAALTPT